MEVGEHDPHTGIHEKAIAHMFPSNPANGTKLGLHFLDAAYEAEKQRVEQMISTSMLRIGGILIAAGFFEKITGVNITPNLFATVNFVEVPYVNQIGEALTSPGAAVLLGTEFVRASDNVQGSADRNQENISQLHLAKAYARDYAKRIKSKLSFIRK